MRALKTIILCSIIIISFATSCKKTDEPTQTKSPVANTTWAKSSGNTFWIEFTSNTDYLEYMGDADGNPMSTGVHYGTYSYSDGKIIFNKPNNMQFDYGTVNGSFLTIVYTSGKQTTYKKK